MMTPVVQWRGAVRLSELGPEGWVWPHRYLEWMQEAAALASTAAGYPPERYQAMGAAWIVREICLAVDGAPAFGDPLEVDTWVSDLRRFRSHRQYRIRAAGRVVARAEVEWLFLSLDQATQKVRPRHPDDAQRAAFPLWPERVLGPDEVPVWPAEVDPQPGLRRERRVEPTEIDRHGHVNHVHYLAWLEDQAREAGTPGPLTFARLRYEADARPLDLLVEHLSAVDGGGYHRIHRGPDLVLRGLTRRRVVPV
jgi:acyl-CoA thioesterase FadM